MIAVWMIYGVCIGAVVGFAALAFERAFTGASLPIRWVWIGALAGSLGMMGAPWVTGYDDGLVETSRLSAPGVTAAVGASVQPLEGGLLVSPEVSFQERSAMALSGLDGPLLVLWASLSGIGAFMLLATGRRLQRRRRRWRKADLDGTEVLMSQHVGPAVVGVVRAVIVVPEWVRSMDEERRRLVVAHEEEHLEAGDPRLLAFALFVLVAMPWNPAVWWQARRLRAALEIDCDARILARYGDRRTYGALLIEIGQRISTDRFGLAFAQSASLLERRIATILSERVGRWRVRAASAALVGVHLLGLAGAAPMPELEVLLPDAIDNPAGGLTDLVPARSEVDLAVTPRQSSDDDVDLEPTRPTDAAALDPEGADLGGVGPGVASGELSAIPLATVSDELTDEEEEMIRGAITRGMAITAVVVGLAAPTPAAAQNIVPSGVGRLRGVVTDFESGSAITSAQVHLQGTNIGALTNLEGVFLLSNVPAGTYTVVSQRRGFAGVNVQGIVVSSDSTTTMNLAMNPVVAVLQEIDRGSNARPPLIYVDGVLVEHVDGVVEIERRPSSGTN